MSNLKIKFFVDVESELYYKIPSPHFSKTDMIKWKLNKLRGRLYRYPSPTNNGIKNIVKVLKKYKIPGTLCIAGHCYLKKCSGWPHFNEKKPENTWYYDKIGKDWYYWDKGGDEKTNPGLYLGNFIEKEMWPIENFSFGLHGFAHEALTLEKKEVIDSIIKAGIKAAKEIGVKIKSFGAPFEMIEDIKEPNKIFNILTKYKIKETQYSGKDDGLKILRKFDIKKTFKKENLQFFWISNYIEGTFSNKKMKNIIEEIEKNKNEDKTYVLTTHDFTWKNAKKLDLLIKKLKNKGIKDFC